MSARFVLGACALLLVAACGVRTGSDDDGARIDARANELDAPMRECTDVIGDLGRPLEVRPVFVDYAGLVQPLVDRVGLIRPIQGGHVLMVGLEARNARGCQGTISGTISDPATGTMIATETRPSQLLVGDDGWGHLAFPPIYTTANLSTCPSNILPRDLDGNPWRLDLAFFDGRVGTWSGIVVPYCWANAPDPEPCPCLCDSEFVFGQACPVDPTAAP